MVLDMGNCFHDTFHSFQDFFVKGLFVDDQSTSSTTP